MRGSFLQQAVAKVLVRLSGKLGYVTETAGGEALGIGARIAHASGWLSIKLLPQPSAAGS